MKKNLLFLMLALIACTFGARADELTVYEGTQTNTQVPIYGSWADAYQKCEMLYDASVLSQIEAGSEITGLTWYTQNAPSSGYGNAKFQIFMKEVSVNTLSAYSGTDDATIVYEGSIDPTSSDKKVTINFETPYPYQGGILLVGVYEIQKGSYINTTFVGASGTSISGYSSSSLSGVSASQRYFVPKTTFEYENAAPVDYKASVSPNAIDFGKLAPNASASQTITIKNKGTNAITSSLSGISAPFSTDYVSTTINGGDELTFHVTFNPTETGTYNQTLTIDCGFEDGVFNVVLDGICAKEMIVADGTTTNDKLPVYGYNYDSYNQQNQFVYPASLMTSLVGKKLKSITFYPAVSGSYKGINFYNGSVTFSLASVAEGSVSFTASDNTPQSPEGLTTVGTITMPAAPQQSLTEWKLTFEGDGFDYYGGDLFVDVTTLKGSWGTTHFYGITTDDYAGYSCTSSTAKTGQKFLPKVMFEYEDAVAQVTVTPTELTFGGESFVIGNTEDKTFKVTNTTDEDVTLTLNDESGFYSIAPTTIEAGATSVTVTVTYAPTTAGTHDATVTVGDKTVTLNGAAVAPIISGTVTPAELTFETYENVSTTQTITIENTGNTAFTPVFSALEAPFSIEDATEIVAGESKDFVVTYAPTAIGTNNSTLTVEINGTTTNVSLNGTATEAPLEITVAETGATAQSQPIPIEGTYFDTEGAYGQTIYNKDDLGALAGNNISKIKYYSATTFDAAKIGGTVLEIYLMETDYDEMPIPEGGYSCQPLTFEGAAVGEYIVQGGETDMEFVLSTPFNYSGNKNLAIQVRVKTKSPQSSGYNYQSIKWYVEGKTSNISYAGNVGYSNGGHALLPKTTFTYEKEDPHTITLAELCRTGVITEGENEYTIKDQLIGVYADDVKGILWCKDQGNASVFSTSINDGQVDFLKDDPEAQNGRDWDQSNWIALHFSTPTATNNIDQLVNGAVNCYIKPGTVKGKLIDDVNYALRMDLDQLELVTQADDPDINPDYIPNVYCPANFMPTNLNIWGNDEDGGYTTGSDQNYFFMNPKIQEICEVTYAQWDATHGCFTVPTSSGFDGAFYIGTGYNVIQSQNFTSSLQDEHIYKFKAIVQRSDKDNYGPKNVTTPATGITLYPVDLNPSTSEIPTAINTVNVNGEVKSVKYYNVAGIESDVPFQGVNIEVTTYTDGSRTTRKIMK